MLGSWQLTLPQFTRQSQTLSWGSGQHIEVAKQPYGDLDSTDEIFSLDVKTEAYDREAQTLTLDFQITNISSAPWDHPIFEPRLYIDFTESTDLMPQDVTTDNGSYVSKKDNWLVKDADAIDNLI